MNQAWRVVLVDDHSVVRAGLRHVLETNATVVVAGEAATAAEGVARVDELKPDLVVLDITMPGASGLAVIGRMREVSRSTRVLMLSMHADPEYLRESERLGASGYLLKDNAAAELPEAIAALRRGERYVSPAFAKSGGQADTHEEPLTPRERDVLRGISAGRTNKEIASAHGISHRTVETHRENIMRKLGIHTVAGLTRYAIDHGLTTENEKTR
ncbi:MAG TPA: response regulator transcription factor [Gemmatimonadaceae bacterium]|nr:response regulator transcription factor [Gemmatimonadaceae bacterium]